MLTREKAVALGALAVYVLILCVLAEVESWRQRRRLRQRARPVDQAPSKAWLYGPFDQERVW